ncbi:MAG: acyl carrier protein [Rubrivivax sp.]
MPISSVAAADRRPVLVQRLRALFEEVSGVELDAVDAEASFVEAGLDSLTLTQVALQLKREFSVPITFRQLMESERSLAALAAFLDEKLPPDAAAPPAAAPATTAARLCHRRLRGRRWRPALRQRGAAPRRPRFCSRSSSSRWC